MEGYYDCETVGDSLSVIKYMISKYHGLTVFGVKVPEYEFEGEGFGMGDDEDGDEERDDDDDDDDEDDKPAKPSKKKIGPAQGGPKQEECKKQ